MSGESVELLISAHPNPWRHLSFLWHHCKAMSHPVSSPSSAQAVKPLGGLGEQDGTYQAGREGNTPFPLWVLAFSNKKHSKTSLQ